MTSAIALAERLDESAVKAAFMVNHHPDAEPSSVELAAMRKSICAYLESLAHPVPGAVSDAMVMHAIEEECGRKKLRLGTVSARGVIRKHIAAALSAPVAVASGEPFAYVQPETRSMLDKSGNGYMRSHPHEEFGFTVPVYLASPQGDKALRDVAVKPLEWFYSSAVDGSAKWIGIGIGVEIYRVNDDEVADYKKEQCGFDYETRIRAALSPSPDTTASEPATTERRSHSLSFEDGLFNVRPDGSGEISFVDDALAWGDGEDANWRSQKLPASEIQVIREWLNRVAPGKSGGGELAELRAERDIYKSGLQVLASTFYKDDQHQDYAKHVLGTAEARLAASPDTQGMVLVPREPTEAMLRADAGTSTTDRRRWNAAMWRAFLDAALTSTAEQTETDQRATGGDPS